MSRSIGAGRAASLVGPSASLRAVVPNDSADFAAGVCRGLYVGGAGAVTVDDADGATVTIISGASQYHPIQIRRVRATNTTATDLIALY